MCQSLRDPSAMRKAGCGFYAASFAASGSFMGTNGLLSVQGHARAAPMPQIWIAS
jgi:hypothetical protein